MENIFKNWKSGLLLFLASGIFYSHQVAAFSLDWSGNYRFEWVEVDRPSLADPYMRKSYGLNYLALSPKLIASDGINVVSKFHILGNTDSSYSNSQAGQLFGTGLPSTVTTEDSRKNTTTRNQNSTPITVSQLYVTVNQEYGTFLAGRAPQEFGLGMTYNAGNGEFDHWYNTKDQVSFKFIVGNLFFIPTIARVYDQDYGQGNSIQDESLHFQYQDTNESVIGVMIEKRKASYAINDAPAARYLKSPYTGSVQSSFSSQRTNFLLGKKWDEFAFKMEAGFITADTGVRAVETGCASCETWVAQNGYGIALELYFPRPAEKTEWNVRLGMATGDDPNTADYEGYHFDRNYDVAMLLFNHRLGQRDFLTTDLIKDLSRNASNSIDDEAIGNAMYLSPKMLYRWTDKIDLNNTLTYARMWTNPTKATSVNQELGYEWDIELKYRMREHVTWANELGILFPSQGFNDGSNRLGDSITFGVQSRLGISF